MQEGIGLSQNTKRINTPIVFQLSNNSGQLAAFEKTKLSIGDPKVYLFKKAIDVPLLTFSAGVRCDLRFQDKNYYAVELQSRYVFKINGKKTDLSLKKVNDSIIRVELPSIENYVRLEVFSKNKLIGVCDLAVFKAISIPLYVVPLVKPDWSIDSLQDQLNSLYSPFNLTVEVKLRSINAKQLNTSKSSWNNPVSGNEQYTTQMTSFRDEYFDANNQAPRNGYYLFVIPGFTNEKIHSFGIKKGMFSFASKRNASDVYVSIIRDLSRSIGGLSTRQSNRNTPDSLANVMELPGGLNLDLTQWEDFHRNYKMLTFYDNYEDVKTNSGIVAYYFWEEDANGFIKLHDNSLLSSIHRPFKKNFRSYFLEITDPFYSVEYTFKGKRFCLWQFICIISIFIGVSYLRFRIARIFKVRFKRSRFPRLLLRLGMFIGFIVLAYWSYIQIDKGFARFELVNGKIAELKNLSLKGAIQRVAYNVNDISKTEEKIHSECFIGNKNRWRKKITGKVLRFTGVKTKQGEIKHVRFIGSSDSLVVSKDKKIVAGSHYVDLVLQVEGRPEQERKVYNHMGTDLTDKLYLTDPAKRILIFVNGYRPSSFGGTFEETFQDIKDNGLEFPQSNNLIYTFDRFEYWHPWNAIDEQFKQRINPTDTYYADGHFSVNTSNHRSILNFTTLSGLYPKRCKNKKHHTCYYTITKSSRFFGSKRIETVDLLSRKSNKKGFQTRRDNGKVAGRNLLQMLNELPNKSANDTLYIIAHSMGFAYSLGIIDVLRSHIKFGGFYIIAPENGEAGYVNTKEWKEVCQYGSKLSERGYDPPCLQDGVAAQSRIRGLNPSAHVFIPHHLYHKKGFYDSHFIGNYGWMLKIKQGSRGAIKQH